MNTQLTEHARQEIKTGLAKLPEYWQLMFKRMYAQGNLSKSINDVVDDMPDDKLDRALTQVSNSLKT